MDKITRERLIEREYNIPSKLAYLSQKYPLVTWLEVNKLYQLSVEETKIYFAVQHIVDIPWGQGWSTTRALFEEKLRRLNNVRAQQSSKKENEYDEEEDI